MSSAVSTASKPQRLPIQVTKSTSSKYIPGTASTLAKAFATDPVTTYMLNHVPWYLRPAAMHHMHRVSSATARSNGGILWEATTITSTPTRYTPQFQAAAIVFTPGHCFDDAGPLDWVKLSLNGKLLSMIWYTGIFEFLRKMKWTECVKDAKAAAFSPGETYYYVMEIGTDEHHRGKGLAAALVRDLQETARRDGKAIWLEASNEGARAVYKKCGFVDIDVEVFIGKGECDRDGEKAKGEQATGAKLWPMIWRPEGHEKI